MSNELKKEEISQNLIPNEEEEKIDEELQKEMRNIKIDDSIFSNKEKKNSKEKKEKDDKKNQKKKGIDFIDYANENNIQINIQYEEDKYPIKKKNDRKYQRNKYNNHKNNNYNNNNHYKTNCKFNKNYKKQNNNNNYNNKYNNNKYNNYNNNNYNKFYKFGGNKFDGINIDNNNTYQNNYHQNISLKEDKDILTYLENILGENNLNKDLYIRNRINNKGQILINDLLNYYVLKKNDITSEKIIELIKDNNNLEIVEVDGKKYINIKNFNDIKLNPVEQIYANKKAFKIQREQNFYQNQIVFYPYINNNFFYTQNNNITYFIYNNNDNKNENIQK